jgi:DNA polymerase bacteriophage-type
MSKKSLTIDLETYSSTSLKECGLYKYVEALDFEILIFAWAFDDERVQCVTDMKRVPAEVIKALTDKSVIKYAFNAAFEIACIEVTFRISLDCHQWRCTMVQAMMVGLPGSLDAVGKALKLDTTKDSKGKQLINFFTKPCKPTKTNGFSTRNFMSQFPEKAFDFQDYCCTDVDQERKVRKALSFFVPTITEQFVWALDQKINKKGVMVDRQMAVNAVKVDNQYKALCAQKFISYTGITKVNSLQQLKQWIFEQTNKNINSLNKKEMPKVKQLLKGTLAEPVLLLREELSRTSTAKYVSAQRFQCEDGRARGLLQYYGASRTGRWGGRGLQIHNLKRNTMEQLDMARGAVRGGNLEALTLLFDSPSEVLSQLTRTVLTASVNNSLICADYSAIEARVTAWLAGEKWRLDVFKSHGRIYEASAAMMFKVPIESISYVDNQHKTIKGENYALRQNGKVSELALGFGGGVEALKRMGALDMDFMKAVSAQAETNYLKALKIHQQQQEDSLPPTLEKYINDQQNKELSKLVRMWRKTSPAIVQFWKDMDNCAVQALEQPGFLVSHKSGVSFQVKHNILWLTLPSGRALTYWNPKLIKSKWDKVAVTYLGVDQTTKQWSIQSTYGGKLTENIVQAIARDLLADGMIRLDKAKFDIVAHVHDEVIIDHPTVSAASAVIKINKLLKESPSWAKDLPLTAECFVTKYYKKE